MTDFGGQKRASSYLPASNYARQKLVTNSQRITNTRHVFYVAILFLGSIVCMLAWRSPDRPVGQVRTPGTVVREEGTWTTGRSGVTSGGARQGGLKPLSPSPPHSPRLLLLSHGRLMWYDVGTEALEIIDEGHGVYYGGFVVDGQLHYVTRPHNWKEDPNAREYLVNYETGERLEIPAKFTHDVVAYGGNVYVADTGNGRILELTGGTQIQGAHTLFTVKEHVNTLAVDAVDARFMWAMLHNLGPSVLAKVDMGSEPWEVVERIEGVGKSSHGVVQYEEQGRRKIVFLDSNEVSLGMVDLDSKRVDVIYTLPDAHPSTTFLKGLCIVDDIAFFGVAPASPRASRADESLECELGAYDMLNRKLLFRRRMPTKGLLNVVAAPQLAEDSTQRALRTAGGMFRRTLLEKFSVSHQETSSIEGARQSLSEEGPFTDNVTWFSGWPRLDNSRKNMQSGFAGGTQLILYRKDLTALKQRLEAITIDQYDEAYQVKHNAWIGGREGVLTTFKPGTKSFHLIFSGRDGDGVFQFPWYDKFSDLLEPLLEELLGNQTENIMRAQFALMPAHTEIKPHVDSGGYSSRGHRIHFVVQSNPDVSFNVCESDDNCIRLNTEEGVVFELNNRLKHHVQNSSDQDRIHLVVDVAEEPRQRTKLKVGQRCEYTQGNIVCNQ